MDRKQKETFVVSVAVAALFVCAVVLSQVPDADPPPFVADRTGVFDLHIDTIRCPSPLGCSVSECRIPAKARSIHGRRVRIRGTMYPTFERDRITTYILIPETRQKPIHWMNTDNYPLHGLVGVTAARGRAEVNPELPNEYTARPIVVEGVFEVATYVEDGRVWSAYTLRDAKIIRRDERLDAWPAIALFGC